MNLTGYQRCQRAGWSYYSLFFADDDCFVEYRVWRRQGAWIYEAYAYRLVSKLKKEMKYNGKGEEWDPVRRVGNPCLSPLVDSYLTFVSEEQEQAGVQANQAAPVFEHTFICMSAERHAVARSGG